MSEVVNIPQLRFPEFNGEWEEKALGVVATITTGSTPSTSNNEYYDGDVAFVSPADIQGNRIVRSTKTTITELGLSVVREIKKRSTLFVCIGSTIGKVSQAGVNCATNQQINALTAKNSFDNDFIYSLLEFKAPRIKLLAGVQAVPQINKSEFSRFKFTFPLLPEQQKIAAFLTAVDNKIEQLSKKQALLGEYKKGLMQQIFSQAIRFHSKGTSSQAQGEIDDTPGQPLLPNGNSPSGSDFPDWEEKKLGDITDLITKGTTPTSVGYNFTTEGINFIKVESIKNFKIDIGSVPKISEECHHHLKRSQLKNNDIVFSIAGTLGRTAIVKNKDLPANTNQALSIIRLNRSQHILFVHYLLNLESIDKYIHRMLSVGAQPNLSLQQVGDIQLQLPSLLEQSKITNFLSSIDNKIEQVGKQLDESKQFKKALLQQMFI